MYPTKADIGTQDRGPVRSVVGKFYKGLLYKLATNTRVSNLSQLAGLTATQHANRGRMSPARPSTDWDEAAT